MGRGVLTEQDAEDFEQELVDQCLLSGVAAGSCDGTVSAGELNPRRPHECAL
jgi:hypothetical protein